MTVGRIPNVEGGIQPTLLTTTGDIMYASSASNPARLGIGSTSQVLTVAGGVPSWSTPSSGGMTLLTSGSLSGSALQLTSISGSYEELIFIVLNARNTDGVDNRIRINNITTSTYNSALLQGSSSAVANTSSAAFLVALGGTSLANTYGRTVLNILDYTATTGIKTGMLFSGRGDQPTSYRNGFWNNGDLNTTAVNRIDFYPETGTLNGGTYELWGVK